MTYREVLRLLLVSRRAGSSTASRLAERMFSLVLVLDVLARFGPRLTGLATFAAFAPGFLLSPLSISLRQRSTGPRQAGQVLAVSIGLNLLGTPIGAMAGGYLVAGSPVLAFAAAGVAALLGALAGRLLLSRAQAPV